MAARPRRWEDTEAGGHVKVSGLRGGCVRFSMSPDVTGAVP